MNACLFAWMIPCTSYTISLWEAPPPLSCPLTMSTGVIAKTILPKVYRSGVSHLQVCSLSSHLLVSLAWTISWGLWFLHGRDNAFGIPTWYLAPGVGSASLTWYHRRGAREGREGWSHCSHLQSQDCNRSHWFSRGHQDSAKLPFCVPIPRLGPMSPVWVRSLNWDVLKV